MKIIDILSSDTVLAEIKTVNKENVIEEFADFLFQKKLIPDKSETVRALLEREQLGSTGIGDNVAIPHARMKGLDKIIAVFGVSKKGVDFDSLDCKPVNFVFMLIAPEKTAGSHLKALARISRLLKSADFKASLLKANSKDAIYKTILDEDDKLQ